MHSATQLAVWRAGDMYGEHPNDWTHVEYLTAISLHEAAQAKEAEMKQKKQDARSEQG